ncbi:hypothetical protein JOM56_012380 [Amanita muscaria]
MVRPTGDIKFPHDGQEEYNFGFCYALPPVVVTPVDLVGVNGNPQPLVDVIPGGNIINVVDEAGIAETIAVSGKQVAGETTEEDSAFRRAPYGLTKSLTGCIKLGLCMPSRRPASSSSTRPSGWSVNVRLCASASAEKSMEEQREAKREGIRGAIAQQQNGNGNGNCMMTRGQTGWSLITDPVKLERRLKRQRSEAGDDASTDSERDGKGRESKCSKCALTLDGQQDVIPSPVPSPGPQLQQQHHLHQHQHVTFASIERQPSSLPRAPLPPEAGPWSGILVERGGEATAAASPTPRKQTGGFEPFLLNPVKTNPPPPAVHTMANGSNSIPPQPIQGCGCFQSILHTPSCNAPAASRGVVQSLAPPMSVDTQMQSQQSGMEVVDPGQSCRNADFSKCRGGGGEQAQHLELSWSSSVSGACGGTGKSGVEMNKLVEKFAEEVLEVLVDDEE